MQKNVHPLKGRGGGSQQVDCPVLSGRGGGAVTKSFGTAMFPFCSPLPVELEV